jgi:hypothetical protein
MKHIMIVVYVMLWSVGVAFAQPPPGGCICGTVEWNPYGCPGSDRHHSIACTPPSGETTTTKPAPLPPTSTTTPPVPGPTSTTTPPVPGPTSTTTPPAPVPSPPVGSYHAWPPGAYPDSGPYAPSWHWWPPGYYGPQIPTPKPTPAPIVPPRSPLI